MSDQPFSGEQQEYLKGFMAGTEARRGAAGIASPTAAAPDPADINRAAQDRTVAGGGKLTPEEDAKRRKNPLDRFDEISAVAADGKFPKGLDVFLTKFHGLFYVAPAQNAFMCRLRVPGGIMTSHQLHGVAAMADDLAGGYADITTRANLQLREIAAHHAPEVLTRLCDLGLTSRGSGADNIRNVTGSPTAGIDPQELLDTQPHARALHHFILNHRELFGLPRKFNIAFDGGGRVVVLQDTNDIAFAAVEVADGFGVPAGVYFQLGLGGITGHRDFARPTGVVLPPGDAVRVSNAILRVFAAQGDRTDRNKARLKYVLDRIGMPAFLSEVEAELGAPLLRVDDAAILPRPVQEKHGHVGVHPQKQAGFSYVGVLCPVGRLTAEQLRGLASLSEHYGSGTIRLTVWQNLLISDIANERMDEVLAAIVALGLDWQASALRAGLVACTGNAGCKFSASNTKSHAVQLVEWLEPRFSTSEPLNIHLTGCHNSCAQHYVADIGLLGAKVEQGEDLVEGYDLFVGGGAGVDQKIGRLVRAKVAFADVPPLVLSLLETWQRERRTLGESFQAYSARLSDQELAALGDLSLVDA